LLALAKFTSCSARTRGTTPAGCSPASSLPALVRRVIGRTCSRCALEAEDVAQDLEVRGALEEAFSVLDVELCEAAAGRSHVDTLIVVLISEEEFGCAVMFGHYIRVQQLALLLAHSKTEVAELDDSVSAEK